MADLFEQYLPGLKAREGGGTYTNRAADRGGPTRWGITARKLGEARKLGRDATPEEVQALTEAEADAIYRAEFYLGPGFDRIAAVAPRVAEELLDTGVNMGTRYPRLWLQEALNLCNRRGKDYADLLVDAEIGGKTLSAISALIARRGQAAAEDLLLKCLNGDQYARYKAITLAGGPNSDQEEFVVGWLANRIGFPSA